MKFKKSIELEEHFKTIKFKLSKEGYTCNPYREINYGIQFKWFKNDQTGMIRVYKSKKGSTLDLSQTKDQDSQFEIEYLLQDLLVINTLNTDPLFKKPDKQFNPLSLRTVIGVDESGKGDYFGPLTVAAVYTDENIYTQLEALGIKDSKALSDKQMKELSKEIEQLTETSIVVIHPVNYNTLYEKFKNINHLLAWGHTKALASLYEKTKCESFLCDQFSSNSLIHSGLMSKGIMIKPYEVVKAEQNLAVAAASILARVAFIKEMDHLSKRFNQNLPKGCANHVIKAAQKFIELNGMDPLFEVAKCHFNVTKKLTPPKTNPSE